MMIEMSKAVRWFGILGYCLYGVNICTMDRRFFVVSGLHQECHTSILEKQPSSIFHVSTSTVQSCNSLLLTEAEIL